jgi:hypothetical protein
MKDYGESLHYRMLLSKMGVKSESKVEAVI